MSQAQAVLERRIAFLLKERTRMAGRELAVLQGDLVRRGVSSGTGAIVAKERLARDHFDLALQDFFNDFQVAQQQGLSRAALEPLLERALTDLVVVLQEVFREASNPAFGGPSYSARGQHFAELSQTGYQLIEQYWGGYLTRSTPHGTQFTVHVHDSPNAAIQQGLGNVQTVTHTRLDFDAVRKVVDLAEQDLKAFPDSPRKAEIADDIGAIRLELSRTAPRAEIIKAFAKSARRICEGAAADGLAAALGDLFSQLDV